MPVSHLLDTSVYCQPLRKKPHASVVARWELLGDGEGIHWPDIDEDLSVAGLLRGTRSPEALRSP